MKAVELIGEQYPDAMVMEGFDNCIVGVCHGFGSEPVIAYDQAKVLLKHMNDGMTSEEAVEFFEFNQLGAYVGEGTPVFIERYDNGKED